MEKKCRYCAMMIPKEASICPHCGKKQEWTLGAKIFVILLVTMAVTAVMGEKQRYRDRGTANTGEQHQQAVAPSHFASIGSISTVGFTGMNNIHIFKDVDALKKVNTAIIRKDYVETVVELIKEGRVVTVPSGTQVKILDILPFDGGYEVRIEGGLHAGKRGFTLKEWIMG